jgi:hypothetical protein
MMVEVTGSNVEISRGHITENWNKFGFSSELIDWEIKGDIIPLHSHSGE